MAWLEHALVHATNARARPGARPLAVRDRAVRVAGAEDRLHALGRVGVRRLRRVGAHVDERRARREIRRRDAALRLGILRETARAGALVGLPRERRERVGDEIVHGAVRRDHRLQHGAGAVELLRVVAGVEPGALARQHGRLAGHGHAQRVVCEAIAVAVVQRARIAGVRAGPRRVVPLPGEDRTGAARVVVHAELSQVLLPDRIVGTARVDLAARLRRRAVPADARPALTRVRQRARILIVAGRAVVRIRIRACTGAHVARSRHVALVERGARHGVAAGARAVLAGVGLRAGVAVVAAGAVRRRRVRA